MTAVLRAYARAVLAQLHWRMLMLALLPLLVSLALWAALLYVGLQPLLDYLQARFTEYGWFQLSGGWLATLGLGMFKTVVVPFVAMLLLLPLMILTALTLTGVAAMPAICRYVGRRQFPGLAQEHGGSMLGSVATAAGAVASFVLLWLLTLPLYALPPLALAVQTLLWGWLSGRVMVYDVLADYASAAERVALLRTHRWPLLVIGLVSGLAGALPGALWLLGTVISVVLFPLLAAASITLYVLIFIFTGLWFAYYCLEALQQQRAGAGRSPEPQREPEGKLWQSD